MARDSSIQYARHVVIYYLFRGNSNFGRTKLINLSDTKCSPILFCEHSQSTNQSKQIIICFELNQYELWFRIDYTPLSKLLRANLMYFHAKRISAGFSFDLCQRRIVTLTQAGG